MEIGGIDIGIITVYMLIVTIVGLWSGKKVKNTEDYYIASRSLNMFTIIFGSQCKRE